MVNRIRFYDHNNAELQFTVPEEDISSIEFTNTVNGSATGTLKLVMTTSNGLLNAAPSMHEKSHFVIIDLDDDNGASGGIIETPVISSTTITIPFVGFIEYLDKQTFIPSHYAGDIYETIPNDCILPIEEEDESWRIPLYSQLPSALIEAILDNQAQAITVYNKYVPWKISGVEYNYSKIGLAEQRELDALNIVAIGTEINKILETSLSPEQEMRVNVRSENSKFYWNVVFTSDVTSIDLDELLGDLSAFTTDYHKIGNGIVAKQKPNGKASLAIIINDLSNPYTSTMIDNTENTLKNPRKTITNKFRNKDNIIVGQMSYVTTSLCKGEILDRVDIKLANGEIHQGIITEISYNTTDQSYTVTCIVR